MTTEVRWPPAEPVAFVQELPGELAQHGTMTIRRLFPSTAAEVAVVVRGITSTPLDAATPCTGFDLGDA